MSEEKDGDDTILAEANAPDPLPDGCLLNGRQYQLIRLARRYGCCNEYEAIVTEELKSCPNCGFLAKEDDKFCESCGMSLDAAQPQCLRLLIRESRNPEVFRIASLLLKDETHPSILLGREVFEDSPYEKRYYWVLTETNFPRLQDVTEVTEEDIRRWLVSLVSAISFLQQRNLTLKQPVTDWLMVGDGKELIIHPDGIGEIGEDACSLRRKVATLCADLLEKVGDPELAQTVCALIEETADWEELKEKLAGLFSPPVREIDWAAATDVGRRREHNEDSYLTLGVRRCHLSEAEHLVIAAVADGMGGHEAGEVASRIALSAFLQKMTAPLSLWAEGAPVSWTDALSDAFGEANRLVYEEARLLKNNMGTTLVAAVVARSVVFIANVGDSRAYRLRDGALTQVTRDHSLVQQLVDTGLLTPEKARFHPQKNVITQAVGLERQLAVDLISTDLRGGDLWLLCSDGLSDMISDDEIAQVLLSYPSLEEMTDELIRRANEAGGEDNITVVLVRVR